MNEIDVCISIYTVMCCVLTAVSVLYWIVSMLSIVLFKVNKHCSDIGNRSFERIKPEKTWVETASIIVQWNRSKNQFILNTTNVYTVKPLMFYWWRIKLKCPPHFRVLFSQSQIFKYPVKVGPTWLESVYLQLTK